jgi:hypothetical protein
MSKFLIIILQCGAFILVPGISFGLGLWLIVRYLGFHHKLAMPIFALLVGVVVFEASFIGMAIDPRSSFADLTKIIATSALIGFGASLFVLIFTPVYVKLIEIFKR